MIRTIFMGTPDFACPTLQATVNLSHIRANKPIEVVAVLTQPDRPTDRRQMLTSPPIKLLAKQLGIPIFQPEKLRNPETIKKIQELAPDLIVVTAYGQIIPQAILEIPKHGAINVHASLLPRHRGASPIQAAISADEPETGITIMLMDEQLDHGPVLAQASLPIAPDETGASLSQKLSELGAQLFTATIPEWLAGKINPQEQNHRQATMTKLLTRNDGRIDWSKPADYIERVVRAYHPWPGAWTTARIKNHELRIKILKSLSLEERGRGEGGEPGMVFKTSHGLAVDCGSGALELLKLQVEGKRPLAAQDFLNGYPEIIATKFF